MSLHLEGESGSSCAGLVLLALVETLGWAEEHRTWLVGKQAALLRCNWSLCLYGSRLGRLVQFGRSACARIILADCFLLELLASIPVLLGADRAVIVVSVVSLVSAGETWMIVCWNSGRSLNPLQELALLLFAQPMDDSEVAWVRQRFLAPLESVRTEQSGTVPLLVVCAAWESACILKKRKNIINSNLLI